MDLEKTASCDENCKPETDGSEILRLTPTASDRKMEIVWKKVYILVLMHAMGIYGAWLLMFKAKWATCIYTLLLHVMAGLGITAGVHRLWSHKAYKARLPLRILLMIFHTMAFQSTIFVWARDHRMHHKYSETDADPHNSTRGLFFSHIGWLMVKRHPEIKEKGQTIDVGDLLSDPVVRFQKKYQIPLVLLTCVFLPSYIPTLWGESSWVAFFVCSVFRITFLINITGLINSVAHYSDSYKWGTKPYDKHIGPVDHKPISVFLLGEGYHNYHHVFPWDYKTGEFGSYTMNFTKMFIDLMAKIGWAYDMKTVSENVIESRVKRTGDGSHYLWGWGDNAMTKKEEKTVKILGTRTSKTRSSH